MTDPDQAAREAAEKWLARIFGVSMDNTPSIAASLQALLLAFLEEHMDRACDLEAADGCDIVGDDE